MYYPVVLFIGLRFTLKCLIDNKFGRFIYLLSITAIMFGVMALVIVLSTMNGLEHVLQKNILELVPQIIISSSNGSLNPHKIPKNFISNLREVKYITPITIGDVMLQSIHNVAAGVMLGISSNQKEPLMPYFINVQQSDLQPGKYNIILGDKLARQLIVKCGDQLRVIVPSVSQIIPMGHISNQRLFNVIGIFHTNSEVDSYQVLVNIQDASRLMHYPLGNITGWRLWLHKPLKVINFNKYHLPYDIKWYDWRKRKGELFQAIKIEKHMTGLLLSLISIVAAFNIITSLGLVITEKCGEIAILQTQGLTSYQIMMIFVVQGLSIGIVSSFIGVLLGMLVTIKINILMPIINLIIGYHIMLPTLIKPTQIIIIMLFTIIITLISAVYPSWYASNIQPAEALHNE